MTTKFTLTGDVSGFKAAMVYVDTNLGDQPLIDLDADEVAIADRLRIPVTSTGTFSTLLIATNSTGTNVSGGTLRYQVVVEYKSSKGERLTWSSPFFAFTADADLADKVAEEFIPPTFTAGKIADIESSLGTLKTTSRGMPSYAPATASKPWDFLRGIYNSKSSNTRIMDQGVGNAGLPSGGITEHLVFGDSLTHGVVGATGYTLIDPLRAWPLSMRDQLATAGVPANGTGFVRATHGTSADPRWTSTAGSWTTLTTYLHTTTVGTNAIFSPDRSGTVLDVWYYDSFTGVFTISVDGASSGNGFRTITANGSAGWKYARLYGVNVIGGFSKIVLTVTGNGGGFGVQFSGASVWTPNGGLVVHNVAQASSFAQATTPANMSWADATSADAPGTVFRDVAGKKRTVTDATCTSGSPNLNSATAAFTVEDLGKPVDQINLGAGGLMFPPGSFIGARNSATQVVMYSGVGAAAVPVNALTTQSSQSVNIGRDPALVHAPLGLNDIFVNGASDATIGTALTTIRNRYPSSDFLLHLENEYAPAYVTGPRLATFQAAMYALADTLDVPLYDWRDRVGTYANGAANGVYGDNIAHITSATQANIGAALATIIGGGPGRIQTAGAPLLDADVVNKAYIDRRKTKAIVGPATTTVETVVLRLPIPASGFAVGDALRYTLAYRPAATSVITVRVRIGTTGTTADAAVVAMSATAATNAGTRYAAGQTAIQVIGASATHLGNGIENVGAIAAAGTASATSGTFNSTVNNYVTVTVQNTSSTTTTVTAGVLEWV